MSSEFHSDETDVRQANAALDTLVMKSLPTAATVVAGLYACFVVLYWLLLPQVSAEALTVCAVITIAAMAMLYRTLRKYDPPVSWTYPLASVIFAFILVNHTVHVVASPIPQQVTNTAIIIIGMGLFYLSLPWMLGAIACLLAVVTWAFWVYAPNSLSGNQLYVLFGSVAVSVMVLKARRDHCMKLIQAQFELEVRRNVERTLHGIATRLLAAEPDEVTVATERALAEVRECAKADASYIVRIQGNPPTLKMLYECQRDGSKVATEAINGVVVSEFPWFWRRLQQEPVFAIDNVEEIPPEGAKEQAVYRATGVKAFLAVPIMSEKGLWGYLGLVSTAKPRKWAEDDVRLVRTLGRNYLIAIDRQSAYQEIENLTDRLYHASRLISAGEMSAAWFHQQRTLFQSSEQFIGAAQNFLASNPPQLHKVSEVLKDLKECCATNRETLSEFLKYTKTGETERKRWSMRDLVGMANQLTRHQAEEHSVELELNLNAQDDYVCCSGNLIVQVIVNLVLNAVEILRKSKHEARPLIQLTLESHDDGWVELSVTDNGPGVPPELTDAIFHRFFSTRKDGFGIGLFIGRKILESHGGHLELNTFHEPGCEFIVRLPKATRSALFELDQSSDDPQHDSKTLFISKWDSSLSINAETFVDSDSDDDYIIDSDIDLNYNSESDSDSGSQIAGTGHSSR